MFISLFVITLHHQTRTLNDTNMTATLGYSLDFLNVELVSDFQKASQERQTSELRAKFMKALQVDKDLVWSEYQSYLKDIVTDSDFEGTAEAFAEAEIVAMEESIYFAQKLEDKEFENCEDYDSHYSHNYETTNWVNRGGY